jgi:hypothetical protein
MAKSTPTKGPRTSEETYGDDWSERLKARIEERRKQFRTQPLTPLAAREFEKDLKAAADEALREILEEDFNRLEADDKKLLPPKVRYHKETYRINKKTPAEIATIFGPITLWSFLYLCEEPGVPGLHPLHVLLGIVAGSVTPVVAERVARWAVDCTQKEVRQLLESEHGLHWSNDRLRHVLREYRRNLLAFRAEAQVQRLLQWLDQAERSRGRNRPVLAVGRDGVMVPIRGYAFQEASAATVSVYDRRRKRLGTVYLGQMPEAQQTQMTEDLTALVKGLLKQWTGPLPRLAYITDKGKTQDSFYQKVLRRMRHPGDPKQRLAWEWVLDFFHVCGYVNKLREALFGDGGYGWFRRMRRWLRDRHQGVAQILRSAKQHFYREKMSQAAEEEFWKAYWYLRNHQRWMDYPHYRRMGLPIGSGVTEAACKTVFTQRLKRSGMRWHKESGQVIVDLRILHLSGIWDEVVRRDLSSRPLPARVSDEVQPEKTIKRAA